MADTPPQFASAAQNALAGMDAPPTAAAPVYQAPAAAAPPTFFGRILQGALNGLAGGLRSGEENLAGTGTPGFTTKGNGLAYAEQLQQQQDAKAQEAQAQKQQQAQQEFENKRQTFQQNQQAQLQQVQAVQAKLNGIHLEQQIQHADSDAQDKYYEGQQSQLQGILDGGGKEVAHLKVQPGQSMQDVGASYLKDNQDLLHDPNTHITYSRDADGETEVHILNGDPNAQVDASHVNSQLKSIGSERQIAPGTSVKRSDFNRMFGDESSKQADIHNAAKVAALTSQRQLNNSLIEERQRHADAIDLEKQKEAAASLTQSGADADPTKPLDKTLETLVDAVHDGHSTPAMVTKGMGTKAVAGNRAMAARYEAKYMTPTLPNGEKNPTYDPNAQSWQASEGNYKNAYNDKSNSNLQNATTLLGTKNPQTGQVINQGAVADMKAKLQHLQQLTGNLPGPLARGAQHLGLVGGESIAEDIAATAPDLAMDYAKFASGGNPSSDATYKAQVSSLARQRDYKGIEAVFNGLDDMAGNRMAGFKSQNPAFAARLKSTNDPGVNNDPNNKAVNSQNPSGGTSRKVGDVVTLRNGKQARIKAVLPGGKYQVE